MINFAKENGLTVTGISPNRLNVQVSGSVAKVESAFHVNMGVYQHPTENRTFYAPDREPTTDLTFSLWHVSGLDNFSLPHPAGLDKRPQAPTRNRMPPQAPAPRPLSWAATCARPIMADRYRQRPVVRPAGVLRHRSRRPDRPTSQMPAKPTACRLRSSRLTEPAQAASIRPAATATTPNRPWI